MFRRDRIKLYFLLIWWIALNVWVWILQCTPFDWIRVGSSIGTLVVVALLAWIWYQHYRIEQKRRAEEQPEDGVEQCRRLIYSTSRKPTPVRCTPQYCYKIWGDSRLVPTGGNQQVGEVWLLLAFAGQETPTEGGDYGEASLSVLVVRYGDRLLGQRQMVRCGGAFPLLIKLLGAAIDLSVQVHPSPQEGGKDEIWYFLETEPTSRICLGSTEPMSVDALQDITRRATPMDYFHWESVRTGEVTVLPAGMIHALGVGMMLIEMQDASDITYRPYDYDRVDSEGFKRMLRIDEALCSATLEPHRLDARHLSSDMSHFVCREATAKPEFSQTITTGGASRVILVGISGTLTLCDGGSEAWQLAPHGTLSTPAETLPLSVAPGDGKTLMVTSTSVEP